MKSTKFVFFAVFLVLAVAIDCPVDITNFSGCFCKGDLITKNSFCRCSTLTVCSDCTGCGAEDCTWNPWSNWSTCTGYCGSGIQTRSRTQNPGKPTGKPCEGSNTETTRCPLRECSSSDCSNEKSNLAEGFTCREGGYWMSPDGVRRVGVTSDAVVFTSVRLCGDFEIGADVETEYNEAEFPPVVLTVEGELEIAGSLKIGNRGHLVLVGSGSVKIVDGCGNYESKVCISDITRLKKQDEEEQFLMHERATLTLKGIKWTGAKPSATIGAISVERTAVIAGTIELVNVTSIPPGSNPYSIISGLAILTTNDESVVFDAHEHHDEIPGGCSNFETKIPPEAAEVRIIFNYKELCPGEIAGIVIGAIIGVIFLSAVAFFVIGGTGGDNTSDYASL